MNYLINESPLVLLPSLATVIGLNEALVLQQMQYWLNKSDKVVDGRAWVYNTYEEWCEQFPFWSKITIKRTILNLESKGLVISANHNKAKFDKTKWYTINYSKLEDECNKKLRHNDVSDQKNTGDQNDPTMVSNCAHDGINLIPSKSVSNCAHDGIKLIPPIPDNTTDNTTYITTDINNVGLNPTTDVYKEIINYLNDKLGTNYRVNSKKTQSLIKARLNEGFTVDDFKKVIDKKVFNWNGTKWANYLRPETLFSNKFESYLNEQIRGFRNAEPNSNTKDFDSTGRMLF